MKKTPQNWPSWYFLVQCICMERPYLIWSRQVRLFHINQACRLKICSSWHLNANCSANNLVTIRFLNSQIGSCDKESISSVHIYVIKFKVIFWTSKKKVYASTNSVIPLFCICSEKKKRDFKIREMCFLWFYRNINSLHLIN